ncbi:MAG: hypothetical protein E5W70_22510 [Mesorhizobium sp.]|uniref:hypothetical protein n=1 Tax=Mesorhizobium sp. TaxID=1871066 RepID=UPI0012083E1D|nr:hypothetical protein [Mesorhizobium sp.]TIT20135.1 MAG: hypothetical protein E5W70_22510 [Mesorhizobium sp.]
MKSKYKYAERRLESLNADKVLEIARAILERDTDYSLSEAVAKIDEHDDSPVTELTRRRVVAFFCKEAVVDAAFRTGDSAYLASLAYAVGFRQSTSQ